MKKLGEEARTTCLVHELVYVRERLYRPLLEGVEAAVVLAEAPRSVRLPRKYDRGSGSMRGAGGDDPALVQQKGYLLPAPVELALCQRFIGRDRGMGCSPVSMRSSRPARGPEEGLTGGL